MPNLAWYARFHGLLGGVDGLRRDSAWEWRFERYGFARIEPYHKAWVRAFVCVSMCQKSLTIFSFQYDLA